MAEARQIRVGVIGTGFAATSHVDALRRVAGVEVAAIAGRTPERAGAAAAALGIDRAVDDWRRLLDDPSVDAVHDCTPNDLHAEINAAALDAGKHLLSEKPLGMDAGETADLARRAAAAGVVSGVCFNYRHFPLVQEARAILAGESGRPHLIRGGYLQDWLLEDTDWNWRLDSSRAGATRAVGDIGSHWIDLVQHVTGRRLRRVYARLGRLHDVRRRPAAAAEQTFGRAAGAGAEAVDVDTEDFATAMFELEDGCPGVFTVSQVTPGMRNRLTFEVDTRATCVSWDQERPNVLRIGRRDGPNRELVRDPALLSPPAAALVHYPAGHQEGWPDALRNLMDDFYAAVREARAPTTVASFADAHRVMQAVDAIAESGRGGGWAEVGGPAGVPA